MNGRSIARDGITAGVIGATAVAVWFLIIDTIAGHPLHTPLVLGTALFSVLGPLGSEGSVVHILAYTVFHYAAFIVVGIIAAAIIHWADREPTVLAGLLILFVSFEVGFYGLTALLAEFLPIGTLAWYQVAAGNLIAAVLMGTYLWRTNPALREHFVEALDGRERA
ncbi:MAG TPA: hypothetical protein VFR95_06720 [Gemmatimonadaceae bacterium]|nr:hypothetical protein [Gemmatimonadaceae bacterium]